MTNNPEPYHGKNVYQHEASGRGALLGRYGGAEESTIDGEALEITADIRHSATYLSPYRMDHIAELHASRSSLRELKKSLFPSSWSDDKIFKAAQSVVTDPSSKWTRDQDTGGGKPDTLFNPYHDRDDIELAIPARLRVDGEFDNVRLRVVVEPYGEGIISSYPLQY